MLLQCNIYAFAKAPNNISEEATRLSPLGEEWLRSSPLDPNWQSLIYLLPSGNGDGLPPERGGGELPVVSRDVETTWI